MQPRLNTERDLAAVNQWNAGKSYTTIGVSLQISRNAVSGAIRDARKRGEAVRPAVRNFGGTRGQTKPRAAARPRPMQRRKKAAAAQRAHTPEPVQAAPNPGSLGIQLRLARLHYSSRTLNARLPSHSKQCRWLYGDILNDGNIRCCRRKRQNKHLPFTKDPFPYCKKHRRAAIYKPQRAADGAKPKPRIVRSKYGYAYTKAA